jgi:acyl-CoA synthetase (AMP-forming)/AMP-acid ligase II
VPEGGDGEELLVLAERAREPGGGDEALERAIRAAVLSHTGVEVQAVHLLAPGTLPRTSSGKMRRAEALRRFLSGTLSAPRRVNALTLAWEVVRSGIATTRSRR